MCNGQQACTALCTAQPPAVCVALSQPAAAPAADFCRLNGATFEPTTVGDLFKCMKVALTENNTGGNTLFATKADPDFVPVCMKVGGARLGCLCACMLETESSSGML